MQLVVENVNLLALIAMEILLCRSRGFSRHKRLKWKAGLAPEKQIIKK
jgi:hypothetical protein